jgi:uncharacterized Tic20 family protein
VSAGGALEQLAQKITYTFADDYDFEAQAGNTVTMTIATRLAEPAGPWPTAAIVNKASLIVNDGNPIVPPKDPEAKVRGSISGIVWNDDPTDNSLYDDSLDTVISGLTVRLYAETTKGVFAQVATTTTDDEGYYSFEVDVNKNYRVFFPPVLEGSILLAKNAASKGSSANSNGMTDTILVGNTVTTKEKTANAGYVTPDPTPPTPETPRKPPTPVLPPSVSALTPPPAVPQTPQEIVIGILSASNPPLLTSTPLPGGNVPKEQQATGRVWALLNLIMSVIGVLLAAVATVTMLRKRRVRQDRFEDSERSEEEQANSRVTMSALIWTMVTIVMSVLGILVFIVTENMTYPMQLTDDWTILNFIILMVVLVAFIVTRRRTENEEDYLDDIQDVRSLRSIR